MVSRSRPSRPDIGTGLSFRKTVWSLVRVRISRSSVAVGRPVLLGRFTSIPRCIRGAVSMKISRRTRITSTSGMMLISESVGPIREAPPPPSVESSLNAIFDPRGLGRRSRENVEQVEGEPLHLRGPVLHAVDEEVVRHDGRDGRAEPGSGRDERLRDTRGDDGEARRALLPDPVEGGHDAPHRAEETDEGCGAGGGGGKAGT